MTGKSPGIADLYSQCSPTLLQRGTGQHNRGTVAFFPFLMQPAVAYALKDTLTYYDRQ